MKKALLLLVIGLIVQFVAVGIEIPREPDCQVKPEKGPFYMDKPVLYEQSVYYYNYVINAADLKIENNSAVTLEVYNPETQEWKYADKKVYNEDVSKQLRYMVNLAEIFKNQPFLGSSKYRLVLNGSGLTREFSGPNVIANFGNENFEKNPDRNLYNYFVWVRSTEPILPVRLYVSHDGIKWMQYGTPQTYDSPDAWKKLTWYYVPYYKYIEFKAKIR